MKIDKELILLRSFEGTKKEFEMKYTLYTSKTNYSGQKVYSLYLSIYDLERDNFEEMLVYDISRSKSEADRIFDLISRGFVTPMTVCDVISDLLSDLPV